MKENIAQQNSPFKTSDCYLKVTEKEAFALLSNNTPITICDVYFTKNEMNGENIIQDVIPVYVEDFIDWKKGIYESVFMEEVNIDVFVSTEYYVHMDDLSVQ